MPDYAAIFELLSTHVESVLRTSPACHDWDHTQRVLHNACHLAEAENADHWVVAFAAILHDIARPEELADQGETCHAALGAERVESILRGLGVADDTFIRHVADCVGSHRYRRRKGGASPNTLEAKVVFDADKLDAIGAVGIGRAFHFAGRVGARLHNSAEEALASDSYSTEDTAYREFLVKLQHVHEHMLTTEGRRIAEDRHRFMADFFDRLNHESAGQDLPG